MPDQSLIFDTILSSISSLVSGGASTTTYILLALIPVCIAVAIREIYCWFLKQNKIVSKLERVEKQLIKSNQQLDKQTEVLGEILKVQKSALEKSSSTGFVANTPGDYSKQEIQNNSEERAEPKSLGDRKFSL